MGNSLQYSRCSAACLSCSLQISLTLIRHPLACLPCWAFPPLFSLSRARPASAFPALLFSFRENTECQKFRRPNMARKQQQHSQDRQEARLARMNWESCRGRANLCKIYEEIPGEPEIRNGRSRDSERQDDSQRATTGAMLR